MSVRPYRGVQPADRLAQRRRRLLDAGLDILSSDPAALTVRGICARAGVAARYFYESFSDKDEFVAAVFDAVSAEIATTTQAAMAAAPPDEQTRAGVANIVRTISGDPRIGRLLFSPDVANAVLLRRRAESGAVFAMLSGQYVGTTLNLEENDRIRATGHFVVGGMAQAISAWLAGVVSLTPEELVDQLAAILNELGDPALYRS
ncbi:TetR/AcrR family transcriptional regulator [Mycobacterium sp.]|jgi:AcrR family transcriptional regulator|uniref:TetR/AcrR family transcriptional regulator n=1 Tax=Mycobacterium sp. TaxID=1785 RepID=UPI002D46104C|nr:TetR/AcrR family transcriptional regulator [Mycobacterium sp.]HZA12185.1 TetR/AcrR family transcriptional regulator [Mycobacterium sp.]